LIDDCWIEKLKKIDTDLILCIKYDYNHDIYKKHTGSSQFEKIKKVIVKCVNNNIMVITFIVVSKYNINYIKEIINDSIDMGALPVFERYIPIKDEKINRELELSKEEFKSCRHY
jgi:sulfatase maturation enzyme AslB (radical SAM superfamily)